MLKAKGLNNQAERGKGNFFSKVEPLMRKIFPVVIEDGLGYYVCGAVLLFMFLSMTAELFARFIFNYSFFGLVDIIALSVAVITWVPLSVVEKGVGHLNMSLLLDYLAGKRSYYVVHSICLLVGIIAVFPLAYYLAQYTIRLYKVHGATMTISLPIWPAAAFITSGCFVLGIRLCIEITQDIKSIIRKEASSKTKVQA